MAFEDVKESLSEAERSTRSYIEISQEYYKLKGFKFLMKGITSFSKFLIVGTVAFLGLLFISLAASYGIGQALNNTFYGFLCVGLFYILIGTVLYALRKRVEAPLLRMFSEFYFDEL